MKKTFCDECNKEILKENERIIIRNGKGEFPTNYEIKFILSPLSETAYYPKDVEAELCLICKNKLLRRKI